MYYTVHLPTYSECNGSKGAVVLPTIAYVEGICPRGVSFSGLKGQCPDYAHVRAPSVFSSKDNRTVKLTRQDFLPDRTADRDLLFIFSSNILDFRRSFSSYIKIWLAVQRLIAILSLTGPPCDPKISFFLI